MTLKCSKLHVSTKQITKCYAEEGSLTYFPGNISKEDLHVFRCP